MNYLSKFLSQEVATTDLLHWARLSKVSTTKQCTPYRIGYPLDKIEALSNLPKSVRDKIKEDLRSYTDSLNWLETYRRPDLSTIINMLSLFHKVTPLYVAAAKYAIKYLKINLPRDAQFIPKNDIIFEVFVKFKTTPEKVLIFVDTN